MYYIKVLFLLPEGAESGPIPSMVPLSTDNVDFINDLEKLDRQSTRTAETVYIFYMKNGQKHPDEILRNVAKADHVNRVFLDFLASLGWPVNVWHHTGWTGRLSTRQAHIFRLLIISPELLPFAYRVMHTWISPPDKYIYILDLFPLIAI